MKEKWISKKPSFAVISADTGKSTRWWQRLFILFKMPMQPIRFLFTGKVDIY